MQHASCKELHTWANTLSLFSFPFDEQKIPENGIYLLFEKGEKSHGTKRVVRVGTHTGEGQLRSRLRQHFLMENKDRSIFRKNIGRCLLHKVKDPFLSLWEIDLTPALARTRHQSSIDPKKKQALEKRITKILQENFSFAVVREDSPAKRKALEAKLIATLYACEECAPSLKWLGKDSPLKLIRESGLWQVQGLSGAPLTRQDFVYLQSR